MEEEEEEKEEEEEEEKEEESHGRLERGGRWCSSCLSRAHQDAENVFNPWTWTGAADHQVNLGSFCYSHSASSQ